RPATSSRDRATRVPHSQPAALVPRDLELVRLPAQRPLDPRDRTAELLLAPPLLLAREPLPARPEQLTAPAIEERLRDRVRRADLPQRAVTTQPGQHDLELLLRRE